MNTNDSEMKCHSLEKTLRKEYEKAIIGVKVTALIYGLLAIFVFAYTSYVYVKIRELATPANVAALAGDYAKEKIPVLKQHLVAQVNANAADWANQLADYAHKELIPQLGDTAKQQLNNLADMLMQEIKTKHLPALKDYLKKNVDEALSHAEIVSDDKIAKAYAVLLVEELDGEVDKIMDNKIYQQIENLKNEVETLIHKPKAKLTKKEDAEKRVLMYWSYLANHKDMGESLFASKMQAVSDAFNYVAKTFFEAPAVSDSTAILKEENKAFIETLTKEVGTVLPAVLKEVNDEE